MVEVLTLLSAYMTGVIWVVQLLVYPNFNRYSKDEFSEAMKYHTSTISFIVIVPMLAELGISVWWIFQDLSPASIGNIFLLAIIWGSTFVLQVPLHNRLKDYGRHNVISNLVRTNWIRTIAWTVKTVWLILVLYL